jgi:hypothetical protein
MQVAMPPRQLHFMVDAWYMVFLSLFDLQESGQNSARWSARVASYAACRGGLAVDDGSWTKDGRDSNLYKV